MGTVHRVVPLLGAVLVATTMISRGAFASSDPPSEGDRGSGSTHPAGKPKSALDDVAHNVANSAREAASMAKDVAHGAAKNTQQAAKDVHAGAEHAARGGKPKASGAKTKTSKDAEPDPAPTQGSKP